MEQILSIVILLAGYILTILYAASLERKNERQKIQIEELQTDAAERCDIIQSLREVVASETENSKRMKQDIEALREALKQIDKDASDAIGDAYEAKREAEKEAQNYKEVADVLEEQRKGLTKDLRIATAKLAMYETNCKSNKIIKATEGYYDTTILFRM